MQRSGAIVLGLGIVLGPFAVGAAEKPVTIDLGGLRKVRAMVTETDTQYIVQVRLLPVSCFDAATNARLNRDKGEQYAYQGLARYLSEDRKIQFEISGGRVEKTGTEGKFYLLTLNVPRAGVVRLDAATAPPKPAEKAVRLSFEAPLFTRKRDHLHTLERLSAGLAEELRILEQRAGKDRKQREMFPLALAELEERGDDNFKKLQREVADDKLLLSIEKEEIVTDLKQRRERWHDQLRQAVRRHEVATGEKR